MFCSCFKVCLSVKCTQPLAASSTQHRGPVITTFAINLIWNYPTDQKLYTFTCTVPVRQVQTFLLNIYKQIRTQIYRFYLNIRLECKAHSLLMYYSNIIPTALTDTQLEFYARQPTEWFCCCQEVHK